MCVCDCQTTDATTTTLLSAFPLAVPPGLWDGKWENQRLLLLLLLQLLLLSAQRWHQRYCAPVAALASAGDQSRKPARQTAAAAHRDDVRHLL